MPVLRLGQFGPLVDAHTDEWVRCHATHLAGFQVPGRANGNLQDADGGVERLTREHLLDVQREEVRVVHHWSEDRVNHIANECRQARDLR